MQVTVRGKLFPSENQAHEIDELMRLQSSCMRYAYQRLYEGKSKSEIEADLKEKFSRINSRYRRGAYFRAKANHESALELVKAGELESPEKVVFGGRRNLRCREREEISNEEWKQLRNDQLYSRGDGSKNGNLNIRLVERDREPYLRVNVGDQEWIHVPVYVSSGAEKFLSGDAPYGVRIIRRNGGYELRVSFEESHEPKIGFEKGAVGVDFNHSSIDLAVTNEQGQLKKTRTIGCHALTCARRGKREWLIGNLAKQAVDFAKYWKRGLVIENLNDVTRGRSNQHKFVYKKFLKAVKRRAEKKAIAIREVNPAYTSVVGRWKYAPYYHIMVHQAAALVVARRGQGFREKLRGLKTLVLEPLEGGEGGESVSGRRVHSWSLWSRIGSLPSRKGTGHTHPDQSPRTIRVESSGTSGSTKGSPNAGDVF